jgi:hypothetical protein
MRTPEQLLTDTQPFPDTVIQQLPPRGDNYVPWYQYAQRLLLHHGGYSWRVTSVLHADMKWAVAGELVLGDESYGAVGEDDTPTAAESNAFKRACAHAGVGLHLYDHEHYWLHERLKKGG